MKWCGQRSQQKLLSSCSFGSGSFLGSRYKGVLCAFQIMKEIIRDCLEITEKLSSRSIAFPAIGTGNLGFPKTEFAELLLSEVLTFSSKKQLKTLQEVQFLLHPSDHESIQVSSALISDCSGNLSLEPDFVKCFFVEKN